MQVNEGNNEGRIRWGEKEKRPGCGSVSMYLCLVHMVEGNTLYKNTLYKNTFCIRGK